jgi:hypothetical protein
MAETPTEVRDRIARLINNGPDGDRAALIEGEPSIGLTNRDGDPFLVEVHEAE